MVKVAQDVQIEAGIKGFIPITMLDWEGRVASTIFIGGCNFRCHFCHNPELVLYPHELPTVSFKDIEKQLTSRRGWIDGVVVSGGEPCINEGLRGLIKEINDLGYPVKLDTNGSKPEVLQGLIKDGLVDYVAIDIKTIFNKYHMVSSVNTNKIKESIKLIISFSIEHEFRTTVVPGLVNREDIIEIAKFLGAAGGRNYVLQQFKPGKVLTEDASNIEPYRIRVLEELVEQANIYISTKIR